MIRLSYTTIIIAFLFCVSAPVWSVEAFPPPEFENPHPLPETMTPQPRQDVYEYVDVAVLLAALAVSSYLVLSKRSRRWIFVLMIFCLVYFGFWREGCVCPIGSIQNVTLAIFDSSYVIPVTTVAFFVLPLVFTLFFGRTFCAAVCPLGAIQDLVLLRPLSVPKWLEGALRLCAYVYLAAAVLFAATGSAFVICRYDPFVSFFRLSGSLNILVFGFCLLLIGIFVGRPYCRFLCPYGVILRQLSRLSKRRVTITPDECIKCRLCEDSCPFGAIKQPTAEWPAADYKRNKRTLAIMLVLLPVLVLLGGWAGLTLGPAASRVHETVRLAERIYAEDAGLVEGTTDASDAFRATGTAPTALYSEASVIRGNIKFGSALAGAFVALVAGLKLIALSRRWQTQDYEADRAGCVACGRCFEYCPKEHVRLGEKEQGAVNER